MHGWEFIAATSTRRRPCHLWPPQFSDGAEECLNCYFSAHVVSIDCLRQEDTDAWRRPVFGQPFSLSITSDGTAPAHISDEFGDGGGVPKTNVFGTVFVTLTSTRWPEFPPARLLLQGCPAAVGSANRPCAGDPGSRSRHRWRRGE